MTKREKPKTDAAPAIGDRLLTLRERGSTALELLPKVAIITLQTSLVS
jgi:hypothetical protein